MSEGFPANLIMDAIDDLMKFLMRLLYNNDDRRHHFGYVKMDKIHTKLRFVDNFQDKLKFSEFTHQECRNLLDDPYHFEAHDSNRLEIKEFIKNLRYLEYKAVNKILRFDLFGNVEEIIKEEEEQDADESEELIDDNAFRGIQPIRVIRQSNIIPSQILERDVLYVATQLANRDEYKEDCGHIGAAVRIADAYQKGHFDIDETLKVIGELLEHNECIPNDFYEIFIYHENNTHYDAIRFEDPAYNAVLRTELMEQRKLRICPEDKLMHYVSEEEKKKNIEKFMGIFKSHIDEIVANMENQNQPPAEGVVRCANEISNNGEVMLGAPLSMKLFDAFKAQKLAEKKRDLDPETLKLLEMLEDVDNNLERMARGEPNKSTSNTLSIKFILQPNAIDRKNYWQCRGSEFPKWFPGFYTIYPDAYNQKPTFEKCLNQMLVQAWRKMAPIVNR